MCSVSLYEIGWLADSRAPTHATQAIEKCVQLLSSLTHTHTHTHTHSHTHNAQTLTHIHTQAHTKHTQNTHKTHTHTHAHTHTHTGPLSMDVPAPNPAPDWLPNESWRALCELDSLAEPFNGLQSSVASVPM